jgi:4-diphosphocytidyl-2C-methyl-D-erythritol kinase
MGLSKRSDQVEIQSFHDLKKTIGNDYVIICGSGISCFSQCDGDPAASRFLASVQQTYQAFYEYIYYSLDRNTYCE